MELDKEKESLLNTIKGSLFEYKVAYFLAKNKQQESFFLQNISDSLLSVLSEQGRILALYYPEYISILDKAALSACEFIHSHFDFEKVEIVSQSAEYEEADLLLKSKSFDLGLSLKLTTQGTAINTKSGGIKSFLSEYFSEFDSQLDQDNLNQSLEIEFQKLSLEFEDEMGLEKSLNFSSWRKASLSSLPGDLSETQIKRYHQYLSLLNNKIYAIVFRYFEKNPEQFKLCLSKLVGFSSPNMVQVYTFLDDSNLVHHKLVKFENFNQFKDLKLEPNLNASYFTLQWDGGKLLIRLKSMNKFTSMALKVNCAMQLL